MGSLADGGKGKSKIKVLEVSLWWWSLRVLSKIGQRENDCVKAVLSHWPWHRDCLKKSNQREKAFHIDFLFITLLLFARTSVCLSVFISFVCLSICLFIYKSVLFCLSFCLSLWVPFSPSVRQTVSLSCFSITWLSLTHAQSILLSVWQSFESSYSGASANKACQPKGHTTFCFMKDFLFSRGHATLHLAVSVGR